jgi:Mrp family chromosome partitioning ATPase
MVAFSEFLAKTAWGDLDYLIIDLPPGTGEEPLTIAQLLPEADGVIIVTTPQDVAILSVRKSISFAKLLGLPIIGVVENMAGDVFGSGGGESAAKEMNIDFLGRMPLDKRIAESGESGKPFSVEDKEFIRTFGLIVDRIRRKVEGS